MLSLPSSAVEMEGFMTEDDLEGMNPFVISLVEESHKISGTFAIHKSCVDQMSAWIDGQERVEGRKLNSRRLSLSKEHRSVTPRRMMPRQQCNARNEIDFRHHPDSRKYIEEYRNAKLQKQEAALRAVMLKNDRGRASDSGLNCSQSDRQSEKPVELPHAQHVERKPNPLIVISSKGSSRPCNLPLEGHFQGRKLQCRPQILPRTTYVHRESLWHQSGNGTATTKIIPLDNNSSPVSISMHDRPSAICGVDKHPFSVSTTKRAVQCTSAKSTKSNISAAMTRQASPSHLSTNISAAIEKCDSWVKNRDQELDNVQAKDKLCRSFSACDATRLSSRASSSKGQLDSTKTEVTSVNANQASSPKPSSNIDYSHYTDMFKNVLEYYGPKRLRPKSNVSLDHQMVSLKS